jgi:imidazolonepropionase-like amidohydrolase
MKRPLLLFVATLLLAVPSGSGQTRGAKVLISGAALVDGTGAPARVADVLIDGDRISAVGPAIARPDDARVVDAQGMTLLPGLIDIHTHITVSGAALSVTADWPKNLMAYLYCGVTTVADVGDYAENFDGVRRLLAAGTIEGARVAFASRFSSPGGHGAESGRPDIHTREVLTPREARAGMAEVLRGPRPDLVKVFTDGWRYGTSKDMTSMDADTLAAIADAAHKAGLPVITHVVTVERARVAARAGADIIGHSLGDAEMDGELTALLKANGVTYVPTLAVYEPKGGRPLTPLLEDVLDPAYGKPARDAPPGPAQLRRFAIMMRNAALAREAGVIVGAGTDAGMAQTYHGWATLRELKLLVKSGMTPMEAITAATSVNARALRMDHERGSIAPGKIADLLLVNGRPDRDIDDIEKIQAVFLGGRQIDRERLKRLIQAPQLSALPTPAAPAMLDDFERPDGRSATGETWVNFTDSGHDRSHVLWSRGLRGSANHTLLIQGRMSRKERPYVQMTLPLAAGGMLPMSARSYQGILFDARGEGSYRVVARTRGVRDSVWFAAPFDGAGEWSTVRIDFARFTREGARSAAAWSGDDLLAIGFEISRAPGATHWLEIDNVGFY